MNTRTRQTENMNAFRALDLPAYATERQVVARVDELRAAAAAGVRGTPDSAAVEAAALRLRQPDMRLVDSLVWRQADLLGQAEDAANGSAQRLRALAAYVKTLTEELAEPGIRDAMSAAGLTAQEGAALCCGQLRPALRGFDERPWGTTARKAAQELLATLKQCEGFASLAADVPCAPAPQANARVAGQGQNLVAPEYTLREWVRDLLGLVVRAVRVALQVSLAAACVAIPLWALATGLHALSTGGTTKDEHATVQQPQASQPNYVMRRPDAGPQPSLEEIKAALAQARQAESAARRARIEALREKVAAQMVQDEAEEDQELQLDDPDDDEDQLSDPAEETDTEDDKEVADGLDDAE
jgi:hypothetical protein